MVAAKDTAFHTHQESLAGQRMKSFRGITLTELLVVVAIMAILMSMGFPAFDRQIHHYRRDAARTALMQLAHLARATAVSESVPTVVCGTLDGKSCGTSKHWRGFAMAFRDRNHNHAYDGNDLPISLQSLHGASLLGTHARMEFNPSGAGYMGSWTYCSDDVHPDAETFKLILSLGGRLRSEATQNDRCS